MTVTVNLYSCIVQVNIVSYGLHLCFSHWAV